MNILGGAKSVAAECGLDPERIFAKAGPAVVQVVSFGIDPYRVSGRVQPSFGTGILLGGGIILTNYHVVLKGQNIGVVGDGWSSGAELIGSDPALDIAIVKVPPFFGEGAKLAFSKEASLSIGQTAFVIGYPMAVGKTLSSGIISGLNRRLPLNTVSWTFGYIQTDAAVSLGNSGGPLLDDCGDIIGVISLRNSHPGAENMGYAVPAAEVADLIPELIEKGHVTRPWHGIYGQMMTPLIAHMMRIRHVVPPPGFLIETIEPGSPAELAGLRGGKLPMSWGVQEIILGGDIITEVNGRRLLRIEDALAAVQGLNVGEEVKVSIWREGQELTVTAMITERPNLDSDIMFRAGPPR